ncbi:hypothetical protein SAMN06298216_4524 [Spirosomataceae bacterium TFI 002]|nr:hypothetical protein SAMN06298216_4524 [Spirosomataceae bacterium TFI 002]
MKKASIFLSSVLTILMLSSFGVAENNKYVRAKTNQVETFKGETVSSSLLNEEVSVMQIGTFQDDLTESKRSSIASTFGAFLIDSFKLLLQNVISLLKN